MKNTFYALVLGALSLSSLKADYIEKSISKGRADAIKALVKAGFTYNKATINKYVELAEVKLQDKKEALDSVSFGYLAGPDLALAGVSAAALVATLMANWHKITRPEITNKIITSENPYTLNWNNVALLSITVTGLMKSALTLYKDVKKKDKKVEAVEKAEKVLRAVKSLKVIVPQIAS